MNHFLGNDIVNLTAPRLRGKSEDARFLGRVFSREEREAIAGSATPERAIWILWAAKEATYKGVTKALGKASTFQHDLFEVGFPHLDSPDLGNTAKRVLLGSGHHGEFTFRVWAQVTPDFVHAVAWMGPPMGSVREETPFTAGVTALPEGAIEEKAAYRRRFSQPEWACISHSTSAQTRIAAREAMAHVLDLDGGRLEIRCGPGEPGRRVPLLFLDGKATTADLTLSHDRPLMAWAFRVGNL